MQAANTLHVASMSILAGTFSGALEKCVLRAKHAFWNAGRALERAQVLLNTVFWCTFKTNHILCKGCDRPSVNTGGTRCSIPANYTCQRTRLGMGIHFSVSAVLGRLLAWMCYCSPTLSPQWLRREHKAGPFPKAVWIEPQSSGGEQRSISRPAQTSQPASGQRPGSGSAKITTVDVAKVAST